MQYIKPDSILVKEKVEEDFNNMDEQKLIEFFNESKRDNRIVSFIRYYNKTVLDKNKIKFSEFKHQWAIQGMTREVYTYFDENYDELRKEIINDKNIENFFERHCTKVRREGAFCSKLFHTFLPKEFPPVDNPIRKHFELQNEDFITGVLTIKKGYELFIKENSRLIKLIRKVLSRREFSFLRIDELSDIRILDMYYWFKISRKYE